MRIHFIHWKWGLELSELDAAGGLASNQLDDMNLLGLYETLNEDGDHVMAVWFSEKSGKRTNYDVASLDFWENMADRWRNFAGNGSVARTILTLGYLGWEDEIVVPSNCVLHEGVGDEFCGELNLSETGIGKRAHKQLAKYPNRTLVVVREVYQGPDDDDVVSFVNGGGLIPDRFDTVDSAQSIRVMVTPKN